MDSPPPTLEGVRLLLTDAAHGLDIQVTPYADFKPPLLHFWADHEFISYREGRADVSVFASNGDELLLSFTEVVGFLKSLPRDV